MNFQKYSVSFYWPSFISLSLFFYLFIRPLDEELKMYSVLVETKLAPKCHVVDASTKYIKPI